MIAALIGITLLALGVVSGLLGADALAPALPPLERRSLGLVLSLALLTIAAYLAAAAGVLLAALGLLGAAAGAFVLRRVFVPYPDDDPDVATSKAGGLDRAAAAVAFALAFGAFAVPVLLRAMPQGWDPAFHCAIVDTVRRLGALPTTWGPYEPGEKFNYPAALHAAIALFSRLAGLSPHAAFTAALLWIGALMLVCVYALGVRFGSPRAGAFAVLLYGLTDGWGTLASHAAWGGLPNLAGLVLMAGFVLAVSAPSRGTIAVAALLAAAMAFTHHLSFALLGFCFALLIALELLTERRWSPVGRAAFWALTLAVATAGLMVLLRPSGRFDLAHAFKFERERITDLLKAWEAMGPVLLAGGLVGLVGSLFVHKAPGERLLPAWAIGLLAFWVLWDMVYRAAVWWIAKGSWTALTPSRGLTDAAVPLSICAAALLARLADRLPKRGAWAVGAALAVALAALGGSAERDRIRDAPAARGAFADAEALCKAVQAQTPPEAVIFAPNAGEVGIWLPYLCRRELNYFPDPGYYQSPYRETKMRLQDPREFARFIASQGGKPVFWATHGGGGDLPLVASAGGWSLYRVTP